jgi:hypothetical protein
MRSSDKYQRFAAECLRLSRSVEDPQNRVLFLQMAAMWIKLAERLKEKAEQQAA